MLDGNKTKKVEWTYIFSRKLDGKKKKKRRKKKNEPTFSTQFPDTSHSKAGNSAEIAGNATLFDGRWIDGKNCEKIGSGKSWFRCGKMPPSKSSHELDEEVSEWELEEWPSLEYNVRDEGRFCFWRLFWCWFCALTLLLLTNMDNNNKHDNKKKWLDNFKIFYAKN